MMFHSLEIVNNIFVLFVQSSIMIAHQDLQHVRIVVVERPSRFLPPDLDLDSRCSLKGPVLMVSFLTEFPDQ